MRSAARPARRTVLLAALMLLAACVPPRNTTRFYTLTPVAEPRTSEATAELAIGVGPVSVAEYLDRPQIVHRLGPTRLRLADSDNWAEPLAGMIGRTMVDNLSAMLGSSQVYLLPLRREPQLDYRVELDVLAFEGTADEAARLDMRWFLISGDERPLLSRRLRLTRPVLPPGGNEELAAALSEALALAARDIADAIAALHGA